MIDREKGKVDCGGVRNEGGETETAGARVGFLLGVKKAMVLAFAKVVKPNDRISKNRYVQSKQNLSWSIALLAALIFIISFSFFPQILF